jgi:hypothetical protein
MAKSKAKLSDFRTQEKNLNKHKPRGMGMLDNVIAKDGWQGAITTAANGETFAGSARLEVAQERFGDESEPIVFDIDGTRPVILRRVDIPTADDPRAIRLGIADNRINEVNYDLDIDLLQETAQIIDISDLYFDDELAKLAEQKQEIIDHQEPDFLKFSDNDSLPAYASDRSGGNKQPIPIVVGSGTMKRWNEYKESIGIKNDTAAFESMLDSCF